MNAEISAPPTEMSIEMIIDDFNQNLSRAAEALGITVASNIQVDAARSLDGLMNQAIAVMHQAIDRNEEDIANLLLAFQCTIGALRAELLMWVLLKRDLPNAAWDQLVAAQLGCLDAVRAHEGFDGCQRHLKSLNELESTLFPPQTFLSAGFVADRLDCSICGERYATCRHLRGKAYMGAFCEVVHRNPRGDHVAIVKVPADKRCRVISIKTESGHRDKLSLEVTPYTSSETFVADGPLEVQSILLSTNRYPYMFSSETVLGKGGRPEATSTFPAQPAHSLTEEDPLVSNNAEE
ncbi:hypothetical protein HH110_10655 [Stenotrophomonas sp. SAM-B]|uniref:hypothetical protein n=1 Tax=Stenotrophomonas sp. SAM-B TaxID=2729141 RepID=UPI0015A20CE5|nr:hypothetical protein [Stenotrophomonas sp. SAM-B]NWF33498.1 hypothetical protein [Stenotrophomonas sp. SAM-B]